MIERLSKTLLFLMLLASFSVSAHHSRATFFDMSKTVELEGEITRVQWRHPHVRYWIQADAAYGGDVWEMETTPPSILERFGINPDVISLGTRVRVAGPPSKLAENVMEVSHVLLPDGREVLLHTGLPPRWSQDTIERTLEELDEEAVRVAEASANGIYRVWTRDNCDRSLPQSECGIWRRAPFWLDSYPLTEAARAAQADWDPVVEIDTGCTPKGMPRTMNNNWPFEFIDDGNQIRLLIEEFDIVRTFYLTEYSGEVEPTLWGHSQAAWEDGVLVVNTTNVISNYFGVPGIQLSDDVEIIERFTLSDDEKRLDYEITLTDPVTFTEPVTQNAFWGWRPGESVKPYNCINTPNSWSDSRGLRTG
jgi:hypothetical protein